MAHGLNIPTDKKRSNSRFANLQNLARGNSTQEPADLDAQDAHEEIHDTPAADIPEEPVMDTSTPSVTVPSAAPPNRSQRKSGNKSTKETSPKKPSAAKRTPASGDGTDSASKLRKVSSDPTSRRIGARIPQSVFADLQCMKALRSESTDYVISASLQDHIYRQFSCACGISFSIGGIGAETAKAVMCPVCRSENVRRVRHNR